MSTLYPGAIDSFTNPEPTDTLASPSHSDQHENANDAIEAIETELGTDPAGDYATVAARLNAGNPSTRVYNSTTQGIANTTATAVTFDSEEWDDLAMHSTSSNTSRFTAQKAGKYRFTGHAFFAADADGYRYGWFRKNGSTDIPGSGDRTLSPGGTGGISVRPECIVQLNAGDYVEMMVEHSAGETRAIGSASLIPIQSAVSVEYLGE